MGLTRRSFVTLCLFFFLSLSYSLFQAEPLEHRGSLCSLPGFLRPEQEDVLRLNSLGRPGGHLWPPWTGQTSCLEVLLIFYVNQRISLSLLYFLIYNILIYLSLNQSQSLTPFLLQVSLDPAGAGPRRISIPKMSAWFQILDQITTLGRLENSTPQSLPNS